MAQALPAFVKVKAQPMVIDEQAALWVPIKCKHGDPMSIINVEFVGLEHYIVACRLFDRMEILRCPITADLVYNEANGLFHHWSTPTSHTTGSGVERHGLTFINLTNATRFRDRVLDIRDMLCDIRDANPPLQTDTERSEESSGVGDSLNMKCSAQTESAPELPKKPHHLTLVRSQSIGSGVNLPPRRGRADRSHSQSDEPIDAKSSPILQKAYKPQKLPPMPVEDEDDCVPEFPPPRLPARSSSAVTRSSRSHPTCSHAKQAHRPPPHLSTPSLPPRLASVPAAPVHKLLPSPRLIVATPCTTSSVTFTSVSATNTTTTSTFSSRPTSHASRSLTKSPTKLSVKPVTSTRDAYADYRDNTLEDDLPQPSSPLTLLGSPRRVQYDAHSLVSSQSSKGSLIESGKPETHSSISIEDGKKSIPDCRSRRKRAINAFLDVFSCSWCCSGRRQSGHYKADRQLSNLQISKPP
ncbi:SPRED3 [Bugula neritina]|uniref:SPRED3 n=1 Tax=Bugula neritina TaxID=10212 RepID=A0A7J7JJE7_BUGNE|nr:SPRED3 [Bugula neritina]